jgi:hypothetical protein
MRCSMSGSDLSTVMPSRYKKVHSWELIKRSRWSCERGSREPSCLLEATHSGLSLDELERRVRQGGYESRSQTFRQHLRQILRSDESFIEVTPGLWSVRATAGSPI